MGNFISKKNICKLWRHLRGISIINAIFPNSHGMKRLHLSSSWPTYAKWAPITLKCYNSSSPNLEKILELVYKSSKKNNLKIWRSMFEQNLHLETLFPSQIHYRSLGFFLDVPVDDLLIFWGSSMYVYWLLFHLTNFSNPLP